MHIDIYIQMQIHTCTHICMYIHTHKNILKSWIYTNNLHQYFQSIPTWLFLIFSLPYLNVSSSTVRILLCLQHQHIYSINLKLIFNCFIHTTIQKKSYQKISGFAIYPSVIFTPPQLCPRLGYVVKYCIHKLLEFLFVPPFSVAMVLVWNIIELISYHFQF